MKKKLFLTLDPAIQAHLASMRENLGLSSSDETMEILASGWLEKERAFLEESVGLGMESVDECSDPACGFLALTWSGSLVAVGPENKNKRRAVYVSIDRRQNVPRQAESDNARIVSTVAVGHEIVFSTGPVRQTSAIYKLAVLPPELNVGRQNKILDEATVTLVEEFQAVDDSNGADIA